MRQHYKNVDLNYQLHTSLHKLPPTLWTNCLKDPLRNMAAHSKLCVRIGTDCSGTDAPLVALRLTRFVVSGHLRMVHVWSCDCDKEAQKYIFRNEKPLHFFENVVTRQHSQLPRVDCYIAGFPCQPFSQAGLRQGFLDDRCVVYGAIVKTLRDARPRSFILENVAALIHHDEGRSLQRVLDDCEAAGCHVAWRVYTALAFGLPQLRSRVYFMGIRVDEGFMPKLPRPPSLAPPPLSSFLEDVKRAKECDPMSEEDGWAGQEAPYMPEEASQARR